MHPTFKWVCLLKIIKAGGLVLHLQALQKSFLPFKGKGLLGGGLQATRLQAPICMCQHKLSLWHYTEHYELTVQCTGIVHSSTSLGTKPKRQSYTGN